MNWKKDFIENFIGVIGFGLAGVIFGWEYVIVVLLVFIWIELMRIKEVRKHEQ